MCTIVAIKGHRAAPLIVAANRDEFYDRPSASPRILHAAPRVIGGVDLLRGGTWMGANERGFFVALTNQRSHRPPVVAPRSRGEIVAQALSSASVNGVRELLHVLDPRDYAGFNLLYGDAARLEAAYVRPDRREVEFRPLGDGVWVLPNDRIGSPEFPKQYRAQQLVEPLLPAEEISGLLGGLPGVLGDHQKPDIADVPAPPPESPFSRIMARELQAICIHTPSYGTRSSTVLALGEGRIERYLFADGPPCATPFVEFTSLLH